jgi:hypothetical protein
VEVKSSLPADGAQLLDQARALDQDQVQKPAAPVPAASSPPIPAAPLSQELAGVFALVGFGLGKFLPSVAAVLDEKTCGELGEGVAPLLEKYGLDRYVRGGAFMVEIKAAIVLVPVAIALRAAIQHDLAQLAAPAAPALGADAGRPADQVKVAAPMLNPVEEPKREEPPDAKAA